MNHANTVFRRGPYRFFFYAGDQNEPPHVHVERDENTAKFWLDPVRYSRSRGVPPHELRQIEAVIRENQIDLLEKWNGFFSR